MGRFGPFVRKGKMYASLKGEDDPHTITLERAQELIREKQELIANRVITDFGDGIQVLNGRYGPYITDGEKNARIPKDREPKSLTHDECKALLEAAPNRPRRGAKKAAAKKAATKKAAARKTAPADGAESPAPRKAAKKVAKKTARRKTAAKKTAAKKSTAKKAASPRTESAPPPFET
jgi:DNA topoisomerase-1